jgi:hypothetical protein
VVGVRKRGLSALFAFRALVRAATGGFRVIKQGFGCLGLLQRGTEGLAKQTLCVYNRCQEPLGTRTSLWVEMGKSI